MGAVAIPLLLSGKFPRLVAPSNKLIVPVGVPPDADTVTVNVTDCPTLDEFSEEATVVVEGAEFGNVDVLIITPRRLCSALVAQVLTLQ